MKRLEEGNVMTMLGKESQESIYVFGIVSVVDEQIGITFAGQPVQYFSFCASSKDYLFSCFKSSILLHSPYRGTL